MSTSTELSAPTVPRRPPELVGTHLFGYSDVYGYDEYQDRTLAMLARSLNTGRVVALVGSGISSSYNHLSWELFAQKMIEFTELTLKGQDRRINDIHQLTPLLSKSPEDMGDHYLLVLDRCQQHLEEIGEDVAFKKYAAQLFATISPVNNDDQVDPLSAIIRKLKIHRFVTTNYDLQIEASFATILNAPLSELGLQLDDKRNLEARAQEGTSSGRLFRSTGDEAAGRLARSVYFDPGRPEELVEFALATPEYSRGVFHLHGIATVPESLVITERDYQRLYLSDDPTHRTYRQAVRLLFESNAMLFVGTDLREPDLLRPLRRYLQLRRREGREMPLFAILPEFERDHATLHTRRMRLYSRYGVKTYYYPTQAGEEIPGAFQRAMSDIAERWAEWWQSWRLKPPIRRAVFRTSNKETMIHHPIDIPFAKANGVGTREPGSFQRATDVEAVERALTGQERVILLVGSPGSGKGSLGQELAENRGLLPSFVGRRFFGSLHFTNDFQSTLEAAVLHITKNQRGRGTAAQQLMTALRGEPHIVVIGGLERLLEPCDDPPAAVNVETPKGVVAIGVGRPVTEEATEFLLQIQKYSEDEGREFSGRIVLTSTLVPSQLCSARDENSRKLARIESVAETDRPSSILPGVAIHLLEGVDRSDPGLLGNAPKSCEDLVCQIHRALRGHVYALRLLRLCLDKTVPRAEQETFLMQLATRVTSMGSRRRAELLVEEVITQVLSSKERERPDQVRLLSVLQRTALVTTPITLGALSGLLGRSDSEGVRADAEFLVGSGLLLRIRPSQELEPSTPVDDRYTAHSLVRAAVLRTLGAHGAVLGEPQRLTLSSVAQDSPDVLPCTIPAYRLVTECAENLLKVADNAGTELLEGSASGDKESARQRVRAAFGLIRSRWTAPGLGRYAEFAREAAGSVAIPHYDAYKRRLVRLLNTVRRAGAENLWDTEKKEREEKDAVLYADELAWLFNELATVCLMQGYMADAYGYVCLCEDVGDVTENDSHRERWCRSQVNLGTTELERGRLPNARDQFRAAAQISKELPGSRVHGEALGYLGLCHHLSGNHDGALIWYGRSIRELKNQRNLRGQSVFQRHCADLYRYVGAYDKAKLSIQKSIATAQEGDYPELVYSARIAEALLEKLSKPTAMMSPDVMSSCLSFARQMGMPRLEADALRMQAEIALLQEEGELAMRLALQMLGIACSLEMRGLPGIAWVIPCGENEPGDVLCAS